MSQENVELMRQAIEAFNKGDVGASDCNHRAGVRVHPHRSRPRHRSRVPRARGIQALPGGSFWSEFDEPVAEIRDLIDAGDHVVAAQTFRGRGKQSGVETSWDLWQVWTLRDGKAIRGQGFTSEAEALEAAGLRE